VHDLVGFLADRNIDARPVWRPMHTQPVVASAPRVGGHVAERLYQHGVCLPSSSSLSVQDQDRVVEAVHDFVKGEGGRRR
jgi:pyridoxal phosphate-dependent aminotransferase EpsN